MQSPMQRVGYAVKSQRSQSLGQGTWCFDRIFGGAVGEFQVAVFTRIRILPRAWKNKYYLY